MKTVSAIVLLAPLSLFAIAQNGVAAERDAAAAATIRPFIAINTLRSHFDIFTNSAEFISHDVLHPDLPQGFGEPGYEHVLEFSSSGLAEQVFACELSGSYRLDRLGDGKNVLHDDDDGDDQDDASLRFVRMTYEHCQFNWYGWIKQLDGPVSFIFRAGGDGTHSAMRRIQFGGSPFASDLDAFTATTIYIPTGEVSDVFKRSFSITGLIPDDFDETTTGFLLGAFRYRIRGQVSEDAATNIGNEPAQTHSTVTADNVRIDGTREITPLVNGAGGLEDAYRIGLNWRSGAFRAVGNDGLNDFFNSFDSPEFKIDDVEFFNTDETHHVRYDGHGFVTNSGGDPRCSLGAFSVRTIEPLGVPAGELFPFTGSLRLDEKVRATFADDGSILVTAHGQSTNYETLSDLKVAALCFIL